MFNSSFIKNYEIQSYLGAGGFGTVYKCKQKEFLSIKKEERIVAVKLVVLRSGYTLNHAIREVENSMKAMNHPHVVKIFKNWIEYPPKGHLYPFLNESLRIKTTDGAAIFIETEFCDLESLEMWFDQSWRNRDQAKILFYQITEGVIYLHDSGIIHRDIKPPNILLRSDAKSNSFLAKICDFGVSTVVKSTLTVNQGTDGYKSPEVLQPGGKYTTKSDVYSLGVMLYEMLIMGDYERGGPGVSGDLDEMKYSGQPFQFIDKFEDRITFKEKTLIQHLVETSVNDRLDVHDIPKELSKTYSLTLSELKNLKIPLPFTDAEINDDSISNQEEESAQNTAVTIETLTPDPGESIVDGINNVTNPENPTRKIEETDGDVQDAPKLLPSGSIDTSTDFEISEKSGLEIKKILENYPKIQDNWLPIEIRLELPESIRSFLKQFENNFGQLILETLREWRHAKFKEAKFNRFVDIIEAETGNKLAAGELRENRQKIRLT